MIIPLSFPSGDRQREFLDYLNSALRTRVTAFSGSAGRLPDGRFESTLTGAFSLGAATVPLTWRLVRAAKDGAVESLEACGADGAPPESEWKVGALEFVNSVLRATLAAKQASFFRRSLFYYIGAQLDGEYWLPGFRFAPILAEDEQPFLVNAERVVAVDMEILAVDEHHASVLADEAARRHAARLSLLLNHGLRRPEMAMRWVLPPFDPAVTGSRVSQRQQLGFYSDKVGLPEMPKKGQACALGKYQGSLTARYPQTGSLLSLPPEARRILRYIDRADPEVRVAFDRGARLYQVGTLIGSSFPSAGLAYRVAALDAISQANGSKPVLAAFVRKYTTPSPDVDRLVEYLWGPIRSAHFHGGEFPLGEFAPARFFEPLMDSVETAQEQIHRFCYEITREAIVRWLYQQLPSTAKDAAHDSQAPSTL